MVYLLEESGMLLERPDLDNHSYLCCQAFQEFHVFEEAVMLQGPGIGSIRIEVQNALQAIFIGDRERNKAARKMVYHSIGSFFLLDHVQGLLMLDLPFHESLILS